MLINIIRKLNLPLFIAKRYLFSKKKQHIINIISIISLVGILVGTMAMVIVMSVFNGFSGLFNNLLSSFDPDLKITSAEGMMFDPTSPEFNKIKNLSEIVHYAEVVEQTALLKYGDQTITAVVKGVPSNYTSYTKIDSLMVQDKFVLEKDGISYAVVGRGIANSLSIGLSILEPIQIFVPKKGIQPAMDVLNSVNSDNIQPSGIFAILDEIDSKYVIVPYSFAQDLFDCKNQISAAELSVNPEVSVKGIQKKITRILGPDFFVKNKFQQHDLIYKTLKTEKLMAYLILIFIIVIASFNLLGSISMLILDKKSDIIILRSMGATSGLIKKIFLFEGWLITFIGMISGIILGLAVCMIQIKFGIIKFPGNAESFIIQSYPVQIGFRDLVVIFFVVSVIGLLAPIYPVKFISKKALNY